MKVSKKGISTKTRLITIDEYNKILGFITEATVSANKRREEIKEKISIITSMLNYL